MHGRRPIDLLDRLPTFRVVAEVQSLRRASAILHVSASALSRTIRLLEEDVGEPLFDRMGRELRLNAAGQVLLSSVREAMRVLDAGFDRLSGGAPHGPLHVASMGAATLAFVLPALRALRTRFPQVVGHLHNRVAQDATAELLRGALDLAFHDEALAHEGLESALIARLTHGVYCGRTHPLFHSPEVSRAMLSSHAFAAPRPEPGASLDGWPVEVPRRVGLFISHLHVGLEACASGDLLAVLPDVTAAPLLEEGKLRRLPVELVSPSSLFVTVRAASAHTPAARELIAEVRALVDRAHASP